MNHADHCVGFADVLGDLIIETPMADEAAAQPYALSNSQTYAPIAFCPFCGRSLKPHWNGLLEW